MSIQQFFGFHTIKAIASLLGADWGCQTASQAQRKQRCWRSRLAHVATVALIQGASAAQCRCGWCKVALFVAVNAATHYVIDGLRIPKALDQALHLAVVVSTAPLLRES